MSEGGNWTKMRVKQCKRKNQILDKRALAMQNIPKIKKSPQISSIHGRNTARKKDIPLGKTFIIMLP